MTFPELPITTDRLVLRAIVAEDEEALYQLYSQEEVARYLYWEPRSRERVTELIGDRISANRLDEEHNYLDLVVVRRDTGAVIGTVNLHWASREHQQGEIGYMLLPDQHGHGFATEAAAEMVRLGFAGLGLHRMYGRIDGRNGASGRVLEKLGMRLEAHLRENEFVKGEWTDEKIYAILRTEWLARNEV